MENENIALVARLLEELNQAKARKRDLAGQLKEALKGHPGYEAAQAELVAARNKMKLIKTEVLASSGLSEDTTAAAHELKYLQDAFDSAVGEAIASGAMRNGQEVNIAGKVLVPVIRVQLKQMSMDL